MMQPQAASLGTSGSQRAVAIGVVAGLHVLLLAALTSAGVIPKLLPSITPATLILAPPRPTLPVARIQVAVAAAPSFAVPVPEITLAAPPPVQPLAPRPSRGSARRPPGQPFRRFCR